MKKNSGYHNFVYIKTYKKLIMRKFCTHLKEGYIC